MTCAISVAKLTDAVTPSSLFSFFSTRAAHDAHVIPPMARSSVWVIAAGSGCEAVVAGLVQCGRDLLVGERCVAGDLHGGRCAGVELDGDVRDARQCTDLAAHRVHTVLA